jgi:formylglycine-generating enzyme required for sulfatase activity
MPSAPEPSLARIPVGEFLMGSPDGESDQEPVHRVYISEFLIGRFEVTQDEYARFVRATGHQAPAVRSVPLVALGAHESAFKELAARYDWRDGEPPEGRATHPVVLVGYDDAMAYCEWLSKEIGRRVRLPTEAEWEKAARGGRQGQRYPWGDEIDPSRCNYLLEPGNKSLRGTKPTGTYEPNGLGLYDMTGNVWEWVSDWYDPHYYRSSDPRDPRGPGRGTMRIVRGGSWLNHDVRMLECAYRHQVPPDTYAYSIGFRIVCEA